MYNTNTTLANMLQLLLLLLLSLSQGAVPRTKIIGGTFVNITQVPYTAILVRQSRFFGGATVISEKFVLSTASSLRISPATDFQIRVGTSLRDKGGQLYDVKRYVLHPLYDVAKIDYDVGVAELNRPIVFGDSVQPIPIAETEAKEGEICKVSGWGVKDTVCNIPRQLSYVHMRMITREQCRKELEEVVTERMVCAFAPGVGPFKGDTGDPVVVDGKLIGLASWGSTVIDVTSKPSVFTNLVDKEVRDFIREVSGV